MRYYKLTFLPPLPTTGVPNPVQSLSPELQQVLIPSTGETRTLGDGTQQRVASYVMESTSPNALQVELNCMIGGGAMSIMDLGSSYVRVWGWPPAAIAKVGELNNWIVRVQAGFDKQSLPLGRKLANLTGADNAIIEGQILAPYGNTIRPEFVVTIPITRTCFNSQVVAPTGNSAPVFSGSKGEKLSDVLARTFSQYYPGIQPLFAISDAVVLYEDQHHAIRSIQDVAEVANTLSRACFRSQYPSYTGVLSRFVGNQFVMTDVIAPLGNTAKPIDTVDMMGPPQYVDGSLIHVSCPLRADIRCLEIVELKDPTNTVLTGGSAIGATVAGWPRELVGLFQVMSVQHVGNNRAADGTGWATHLMLSAIPVTSSDYGKPQGSQSRQASAPQTYGNN